MQCPLCDSKRFKRYGRTANGDFKYCCQVCGNVLTAPKTVTFSLPEINFLKFKSNGLVDNKFINLQSQFSNFKILFAGDTDNNKQENTITNKMMKYKQAIYRLFVNHKNHISSYAMIYKFFYGFSLITLCTAIALGLSYSINNNFDERYYPMFYHQADAFLQGRVDFGGDWTHDLIPFNDKIYLAIPPLNSFLILPFVYFFKEKFTETWFANILYTCVIIVQFIYVEKFAANKNIWQRSLLFVFLALGTMILPSAIIGTSWFNAVLGSSLFLSLAWVTFYYAKDIKQDLLALTWLAIASIGRFHLALLLPLFIITAWHNRYRRNFKALIILCVPFAMFILFVMWWNWVRFGNPFFLKYEDLVYAEFFRPNIQKYGFRNLVYIFPNIYHGIIAVPKLVPQFPFFTIDDMGNGVLATSPLFLYIFANKHHHKPSTNFAWLCIAIIAIPVFTHCSTGWRQFGYRYFLDFLPFVSFLLLKSKVNPLNPLAIFCILISIWFNIFGSILFLKPEMLGM